MSSLLSLVAQATSSSAYETGKAVGRIAFFVLLVLGLLWMLKRLRRK